MTLNLRCRIAAGRDATIKCLAHSVGSGKTEAAIRGIQANPGPLLQGSTIRVERQQRLRKRRRVPSSR